jgi:hypothetical protein
MDRTGRRPPKIIFTHAGSGILGGEALLDDNCLI